MKKSLDQVIRFRLLKRPRSSAPAPPSCVSPAQHCPAPHVVLPPLPYTRPPGARGSDVGAGSDVRESLEVALVVLCGWPERRGLRPESSAMSIEIESSGVSLVVSDVREVAGPGVDELRVEAARGRRPRGWECGGVFTSHKEAFGI